MESHSEEWPLSCDTCLKRFKTSAGLMHHKKRHTGEKRFVCLTCSEAFHFHQDLAIHRRMHVAEKAWFPCDTCGKRFRASKAYETNRKVHAGKTPYSCNFCGKEFRRSHNLRRHTRIHTKEKPFPCDAWFPVMLARKSLEPQRLTKHIDRCTPGRHHILVTFVEGIPSKSQP